MNKIITALTAVSTLLIASHDAQAAPLGSFHGSVAIDASADGGSDTTIEKKRITSIQLDASFDTAMPTATLHPDGFFQYTYAAFPTVSFGLDGGGTWSDGGIITDTEGSVFQIAAGLSGELRLELYNDFNVPGGFSAPGVADGTYDVIGFLAELFVSDRTGLAPGDPTPADGITVIEVAFFGAFAGDTFDATPPTVFPDVFSLDPAFVVAYVSEYPRVGGFPDPSNPLGNVEVVSLSGGYSLAVADVPLPGALPLALGAVAALLAVGRRTKAV